MKRLLFTLFAIFSFARLVAQSGPCLTNSLIINTGYDPILNVAIPGGANGAPAVIDPHWTLTAVSPGVATAIAATPIPGLVAVVPGANANVVVSVGGWATNPVGNPGRWISCLNSNTYYTSGTGTIPYNMKLGRKFRMCSDDSITITFHVANDNYIPATDIDGTLLGFSQPAIASAAFYSTYALYTQTVFLTAGIHTFNVTVADFDDATTSSSNPTGLDLYGTVSSATGTNSLVSESYASCSTYVCGGSCNQLSAPDSLNLCFGDTVTIAAAVIGSDSVLSYTWSPAAGLSSTTILDPVVTAITSGWYYLTLQSLIPYNMVINGDFSGGNYGFSSSYIYSAPPSTTLVEGHYSVYNNPFGVHTGFTAMGDHTTGTGSMMIINGGSGASSVWCQTITVAPNTDYDFSAWFANSSAVTTGAFVPILQFQVNGVLLGTPTSVTAPPGTWVNFFSTWNSGPSTTATICIYDGTTAASGNDFVIDDISFREICVAKDSVYVKLCSPVIPECNNTITLADSLRLCVGDTATLHPLVTGTDSVIGYLWSPATGLSNSTILNPVLTAGTSGWEYLTVRSLLPYDFVLNGDFNVGNAGFTNGYTLGTPSTTSTPGNYAVDVNPTVYDASWAAIGDHTSGTGKMLMIDGSPSAGTSFWCETFTVVPNTDYVFSLWGALLHTPLPSVQISINGTAVSTIAPPTSTWTQYGIVWNSGAATTANICMTDLNTAGFGNDFAIDDISFRQVCVARDSIYLLVTTPDTITANVDTTVCASLVNIVLNAPSGYTSPTWSTGATTSSITIISPGSYWVSFTSNCVTKVDTFDVTFKASPIVNLGNDTSFCVGDSLILTSVHPAGDTFLWSTGSTTDSIHISTSGSYTLTVSNGCPASDAINVIVSPHPLVALGADTSECNGSPIVLQSLYTYTAATYLWSDATTTVATTATATGTYWLQVTIAGCAGADTVNVTIWNDTLGFYNKDTAICKGNSIQVLTTGTPGQTYLWIPVAGVAFPASGSPLITPDTSATYVLTVKFPGCPDLVGSFHIDVQPTPRVYVGGNRQVCAQDTLHITASVTPSWYTGYNYSWSPSVSLDNSSTSTVVFTAGDSTNIILTVTTSAGCTGVDSAELIVHPKEFVNFDTSISVCPGDSVQLLPLAINGIASYTWHPGLYLSDSTSSAPWVHPITSQWYWAVAVNQYGCFDTVSTHISVRPGAVLHLGDSVTLYPGESYQLSPQTNCVNFVWSPPSGLNNAYISNPLANPAINTKYVVYGSTEWGCKTKDSINIYVDEGSLLAVPNAFAPGSGPNKVFKVLKRGIATLTYFRIYNRWGNAVFQTSNIDEGWDGTYHGTPQPYGVYVYEVEAVTSSGKIFHKAGNVTLVR